MRIKTGTGDLARNRRKISSPPIPGQHQIEHDKRMLHREGAFQPANPVVNSFDCEAFGCEALREQSAQLNIIIDDENAIHAFQSGGLLLDASPFEECRSSIYKSLPCLANLYRMRFRPMVES